MKRISIILLLTLAASSMQAQRIKGSDTVLPVAQQTAERFMALNPDARITVTGGGTGVGRNNGYRHGIPPHQVQ